MSRHHKKMHEELSLILAQLNAYDATYTAEIDAVPISMYTSMRTDLDYAIASLSDALFELSNIPEETDHANSSRENSRAYQAEQNAKDKGL